ncbi:MAG: HesA/MoeB/ThiF family protein [Treponema sp.]|jgi:adenylyltransferase/sulfurtransferase|nr:HesA/MoeB/ThiF family protein [Treponema sp.]
MSERYSRQITIPQIGNEGQKKLARSSVIVAGAGGLGSPALTYLAAAGVGRLGFIDSDTVALSNLNRQFLHNTNDIGKLKTASAKEKLRALNDKIEINSINEHITGDNAAALFSGYDIALGAVDSFETRFVINRACVSLNIPYIDGGINGFSGCVLFSNPPHTPCLSCIFPETAAKKEMPGVFGTTAGITGAIEANIALLYLLGLPNPVENKLLMYDGLRMDFDLIEIKRNEECRVCNG